MVAQYLEMDGLYFIEYILTENYFRRKSFTSSSLNLLIISVLAKFDDVIHDVIFDPLTSFDKTRKVAPFVSNMDINRFFSCIRRHIAPCLRITLC